MRGLGELESAIMDVIWDAPVPLRVREVLERLSASRQLAYTTVMTVMDNLHRKQLLMRQREGRAYIYRPAFSREEAAARTLRELLNSSGDPEAALLHFVRSASPRESALIRKALDEKKGPR
jgi:predicted transcriptional regulator